MENQLTQSGGQVPAVVSSDLLGVWECFCDPCYYDMWAVRRTHERGWGECFHMNSAEEAKALTALLNHASKLAETVNEAARCFYGPEEQKPGTWGWDVAIKLHALSSPNHILGESHENPPSA